MSRKGGLGRGLDALLPEVERQTLQGASEIPVSAIRPNPRQPRMKMDPQELSELADSIREYGVLQPLIVTRGDEPEIYILIAGERRWLAARQAGLERVPVIVREASDQQRLELALIENVQRADLSPLETAQAFQHLVNEFHLSHEEIAARVARSRVSVTNTLRLLKLPAVVQQALADGRLSEGHARALLGLNSSQAQAAALKTILEKDLTVRQTEELVRRLSGERPPPKETPAPPPEILALQERLETSLSTRVDLRHHKKGGAIVIHYYSDEELNALVERLAGDL